LGIINQIKLFWQFYKYFAVTAQFLTLCSLSLFWKFQFSIFSGIFWFKIITLFLIYYFVDNNKKKEFFYFYNLGLTKRKLWTITLLFDFFIFILSIILLAKIQ